MGECVHINTYRNGLMSGTDKLNILLKIYQMKNITSNSKNQLYIVHIRWKLGANILTVGQSETLHTFFCPIFFCYTSITYNSIRT